MNLILNDFAEPKSIEGVADVILRSLSPDSIWFTLCDLTEITVCVAMTTLCVYILHFTFYCYYVAERLNQRYK